jgi:7-cyano-7-deazaguanine synthase
MNAITIVSGGLDSVTLAYLLASQGHDLHLLSFNYGQRHKKELDYARRAALALHARYDVLDLSALTPFLSGSALTDDIDVPEGHYAAPTMAVTVVPNRNAIMLAVAYAVAVAEGAEMVATAVHAGDHFIYPDCRPEFIQAFDAMERYATDGYAADGLHLNAPFVNMSKAEIVTLGASLFVPYADTWSCYKGGEFHCGVCGTCVERREAFQLAGVTDPTIYMSR